MKIKQKKKKNRYLSNPKLMMVNYFMKNILLFFFNLINNKKFHSFFFHLDFSNKYDQKDCDDGDELTSSQNHFLHDDTDSDLYHERFNNTLSSFSIESENKLDNTIELSSDVEEIEETIVDDHQSTETIFTLTNNNNDDDLLRPILTYGSEIWINHITKKQIQKLESTQHQILRQL